MTIAGTSVGLGADYVVRRTADGALERMRVRGRWFYVKLCRLPEQLGGGLVRADPYRELPFGKAQVALVLAIGDGVGRRHKLTAKQRVLRGMAPSVEPGVMVHDKVLIPFDHEWGTHRMTGAAASDHLPGPEGGCEGFVHECVVIAKLED